MDLQKIFTQSDPCLRIRNIRPAGGGCYNRVLLVTATGAERHGRELMDRLIHLSGIVTRQTEALNREIGSIKTI